ncbi:MAG: hypothetical protein K6U14_04610 [Firmicutes bacterium]|nr:hypothetical protein [Alicyclobacillaceae bacterium]MCL6496902.1 hypothetical protein [Bacillota bacterium]
MIPFPGAQWEPGEAWVSWGRRRYRIRPGSWAARWVVRWRRWQMRIRHWA